tara:strand:- start:343 stop:711 length:369 start_codon:yes stop_codon:yes gene_type:complete
MKEKIGDYVRNCNTEKDVDEEYPVMCESFVAITEEMFELFKKKQSDYGPTNIGMGNRTIDTDGDVEKSMIGLTVRMNDKIQRLMNLVLDRKSPQNESVEDTLIDIANYAVMAKLVINKEWGK